LNVTIVNTSGKYHTVQANPINIQNAIVPIFTDTLLIKRAEEPIVVQTVPDVE